MGACKAFVARSFRSVDCEKIVPIIEALEDFAPLGLILESAESAELESVSRKVQQKIDECDLFVAVFTRRYPIFAVDGDSVETPPSSELPMAWTGPAWLYQELGYALKAGKKLLLIREVGVDSPSLQGDLEHIEYDPDRPQKALRRINQIVSKLLASTAGITVTHVVTSPDPIRTDPGENLSIPTDASQNKSDIQCCMDELVAAVQAEELVRAKSAEENGLAIIRQGKGEKFTELRWRSFCLFARVNLGDTGALGELQQIVDSRPMEVEPYRALAGIKRNFGDFRAAADLFVAASVQAGGTVSLRIRAAESYRSASLWGSAMDQLRIVLHETSLTALDRADALKQMFWVLKESGDRVGAFCFGESALQLVPNDHDFRFSLAYA